MVEKTDWLDVHRVLDPAVLTVDDVMRECHIGDGLYRFPPAADDPPWDRAPLAAALQEAYDPADAGWWKRVRT